MDHVDLIKRSEELIEHLYKAELHDVVRKGKKSIYIDFRKIAEYDMLMAEELLEMPEEVLKSMELACGHFDVDLPDDFFVRITHIPKSSNVDLWKVRNQVNKFVSIEGIISKIGDILTRAVAHRLECTCGQIISILNKDRFNKQKLNKIKCSCGRNGKCRVVGMKTKMFRKVIIEEDVFLMGERQMPRSKMVILEDDLVSEDIDIKTLAGKKVRINGYLEYYEVNEKSGDLDTYLFANSVEFIEMGWPTIKITPTEAKQIQEIGKSQSLIKDLSQSIAPDIVGEEDAKQALLLQLVGSENVKDDTGYLMERGCIHIGFIGPPGVGKTYLAKRMVKFSPVYMFTSAVTASGVGLVATVQQDKQLGKWVLIPGAIPKCNGGMTVIDELEKMNKEEFGHLNNAMNDLKVTIMKAAQGTLETDTSILATMNPHGRVFLDDVPITEQIDLPKDLIDRFDLIFPITAKIDEDTQSKILQINLDKRNQEVGKVKPIYDEEFMMKYFAYARQIKPVINESLHELLKKRVLNFMAPSGQSNNLSNRVFNVILRLIYASARIHLHEEVTIDDINEAMDVLVSSYKKQGLINTSGLLDYARVEHIEPTKANLRKLLIETLDDMGAKNNDVMQQDLIDSLSEHYADREIEQEITQLKTKGELMEPRRGILRFVP